MKTSIVSKASIGAVFGLAVALSSGVHAENYGETHVGASVDGLRTVTVSYADLDLSDPRGQKTLEKRIKRAARKVCGSTNLKEVGSLSRVAENRNCYESAIAGAQVMNPAEQVADAN